MGENKKYIYMRSCLKICNGEIRSNYKKCILVSGRDGIELGNG